MKIIGFAHISHSYVFVSYNLHNQHQLFPQATLFAFCQGEGNCVVLCMSRSINENSLFWDFRQRRMVSYYGRFRAIYRSSLQYSIRVERKRCSEISVKKTVDLRCEKSQNNEDLERKRVSCEVSSVVLHAI
jgi:hypothetical protein